MWSRGKANTLWKSRPMFLPLPNSEVTATKPPDLGLNDLGLQSSECEFGHWNFLDTGPPPAPALCCLVGTLPSVLSSLAVVDQGSLFPDTILPGELCLSLLKRQQQREAKYMINLENTVPPTESPFPYCFPVAKFLVWPFMQFVARL